MKFDGLDARMRVFETAHDHCVLPGIHIVARLDGRSFTRLTKDVHDFDAPYDERFRDLMLDTAEHLIVEFNAVYGYTQSDEISLLFPPNWRLFNRKLRKINSVLAGHASAVFSRVLEAIACFDCRVSQLPSAAHVVDYFRWRNEDACRNALNAHAYWCLRKLGQGPREATGKLRNLSVADKNELLFQHGINFNELPDWQKRGMGLYWEPYEKEGVNPMSGERVTTTRRRVARDLHLPMKDAYSALIRRLVTEAD